ncbi:uncharacterized protein DUF3558 [Actinocrispum wychmicini]|uniref:Uncharacterized protein DUF3558 n=2 Tax=Actinocrispum wychmicini TaxID=1213861 RepID=A0A4R2IP28_9PSEU|nr:uncharacterized protein DUF3558 [Actinocrispum wychmicini]
MTGVRVTPVPAMGIDLFAPGRTQGDVEPRTVQGFPAFQDHINGSPVGNDFCNVTVDVADGQVLDVGFFEVSIERPLGSEVVCQKANDVANAAMTTLLSR